MHKTLLFIAFNLTIFILKAQTAETIIADLKSINSKVTSEACNTGIGNIISNRAMNIFLSNAIGSYLTDDDDLSLYKNSIRFNTIDGTFSVTHNLRQAKGLDEPVKSFVNIGARANIINGILSRYNNTSVVNDLGFLLKKTWMGKTSTHYNKCTEISDNPANHKILMDAERASILNRIEVEIRQRDSLFKNSLSGDIAQMQVPVPNAAASILRTNFYSHLKEEFNQRFAALQSEALLERNYFSLITTHWTIFSIYVPVILQKLYVAQSFRSNFESKHVYPAELSLTHTRFWESSKYGRFIMRLNGKLLANNSYRSKDLLRSNRTEYKLANGTDTLHVGAQNSNELLIGRFHNFITPQVNANFVYIPATSHFGLSAYLEQNFGRYKALNGKIGIPVELIDKKGDPDLTFEFQVRFFDLSNKIQPAVKRSDKTSIGMSLGIPFSKIVY